MMKFITEEYLRDFMRKESLGNFKLDQGQRLTPGARQFLSDKGFRPQEEIFTKPVKAMAVQNEKPEKAKAQVHEVKPQTAGDDEKLKKQLRNRIKSMEAKILVFSSEVLNEDIILAQNIIGIGRKLSNIRRFTEGKAELDIILCSTCTGINENNFSKDIDDCFEIGEFHIQLKNGKIILKMHEIRCELRELEMMVSAAYPNDNDKRDKIMANVNSIINSLSQMICSTVGGMKCQRKS